MGALSVASIINIALDGQVILRIGLPIRSKSTLCPAEVIELAVVAVEFGPAHKRFCVDPVVETTFASTFAGVERRLVDVATLERQQCAFGFPRVLGDDVDHTVDGIGPPNGSARAPDDLDSLDVLHQGFLNLPIDAVEKGRVNGTAIN